MPNNYILTNSLSNEEYKKRTESALNCISSILEKSLGLYGSTTVVQDPIDGHFVTKDGYSILKKIKFGDEVSSTILSMINEISRDLVREVGDGSTSSVVTANYLFNLIKEKMNDEKSTLHKVPPQTIMDTLNFLQNIIIDKLKERAIPITDENFDVIKNIATVSNNNDEYCGNIIYDIYKEIKDEGFIFLENSHNEKDHYEILNGMEISRGYIDRCFANQNDKITCTFDNPYILMVDDTLDDTDLNFILDCVIGPIVGQRMKPVVIIAKNYTIEFVNCWKINKSKNPDMKISLVDFRLDNYDNYDIFEDLAIYLNARILNKRNFDVYKSQTSEIIDKPSLIYNYLGQCDKVISNDKSSKFVGGRYKEEIVEFRLKSIDEKIKNIKLEESKRSIDNDLFKLQKRKANLKAKIARLFVGGATELEKDTRKYLMEDSIFACKSALKYGYIPGCNLSICKIVEDILKEDNDYTSIELELLNIIKDSFYKCFERMLKNANIEENKIIEIYEKCIDEKMIYNLKNIEEDFIHEAFENDDETTIINSVMTDIMIMKASFSIIGLLVTSNQFISNMADYKYYYGEYSTSTEVYISEL